MIKRIIKIFDKQVLFLESPKVTQNISSFLVLSFIATGICSLLVYYQFISIGRFNTVFKHPFFAIEVAFTILLILELLSLIFVLPKSVSRSLGKQFELLSLIFLRDAFKEFSHLDSFLLWEDSNQTQFVRVKKFLALFLLIAFFFIGIRDTIVLIQTGKYLHSFDTFYTVLIFSDIVIVLFALRYTINYYRVFRYTAFVLATILIRISLTLETYYNVILGVITTIFVLLLSIVYNHLQKWLTDRELKN